MTLVWVVVGMVVFGVVFFLALTLVGPRQEVRWTITANRVTLVVTPDQEEE